VRSDAVLLFAAALHRGGNAHRLAIFRDGAARDVDAGLAQLLDDGVVRQDVARLLRIDQLADAVADGFRRVRLAAVDMTLAPADGTTIAVDPYPFDQPSLTANLIFRRLPQTKFADSAELQSVYFKTAPQIQSFRLVKAK
jgi:hypothetical protein